MAFYEKRNGEYVRVPVCGTVDAPSGGNGVYIGSEQPTNGALYWLDTSEDGTIEGGTTEGGGGENESGGSDTADWTYDASKWVEGQTTQWDTGEVRPISGSGTEKFGILYDEVIPVYGCTSITWSLPNDDVSAARFGRVVGYDENMNYVSQVSSKKISETTTYTADIASTWHYARVCMWGYSFDYTGITMEVV